MYFLPSSMTCHSGMSNQTKPLSSCSMAFWDTCLWRVPLWFLLHAFSVWASFNFLLQLMILVLSLCDCTSFSLLYRASPVIYAVIPHASACSLAWPSYPHHALAGLEGLLSQHCLSWPAHDPQTIPSPSVGILWFLNAPSGCLWLVGQPVLQPCPTTTTPPPPPIFPLSYTSLAACHFSTLDFCFCHPTECVCCTCVAFQTWRFGWWREEDR